MSTPTIIALVFNAVMLIANVAMFFVHRKHEPWKSETRKWRTILAATDVTLALGFAAAVAGNLSTGIEPLHIIYTLTSLILIGIGLAHQVAIIIHYYRLSKKYQREAEAFHAQTIALMREIAMYLEQSAGKGK